LTLLLGRNDQCDLRLYDDNVSRVHALLRRDDSGWIYQDLGSANGSALEFEGQRTTLGSGESIHLSANESILIGSSSNRLEALTSIPDSDVGQSTRSLAGRRFEARLASVAGSPLPVALRGPSGSGKTWAARVLHERSGRPGSFVPVNCARLPTDLVHLHSELLGHRKGAFTGAETDRQGLFFAADGGTLFLDEIESLSDSGQGFLLDLVDQDRAHALLPLGVAPRAAPRRPEVVIITASKRRLTDTRLRADLVHRLLAGEHLVVPRLSERSEDIPGLVAQFARAFAGSRSPPVFSAEAITILAGASWLGEVRELRGSVEVLVDRALRAGRPVIDVEAVRERLDSLAESRGPTIHDDDGDEATELRVRPDSTLAPAPAASHPQRATEDEVRAALSASHGNIEHAARRLGWARNTLVAKMDRWGIPRRGRTR
jgi:DNA-binding NtrC family response regulator